MIMKHPAPLLISGVNGFVGSRLALELIARGHRVRGTVRDLGQAETYDFLYQQNPDVCQRLELLEADLLNPADWRDATQGVDFVLHVASVKQRSNSASDTEPECLNLLRAALHNGVRKVVCTLGCMSMIPADPSQCVAESNPGLEQQPYASAVAEEREIWRFYQAHKNRLAITTLHPSLILGPRLSARHRLSMCILEDYLQGTLVGSLSPELYLPVVDLRDVCEAHIRALFEPKTHGRRYLIANRQGYALTDFLRLVSQTANRQLAIEPTLGLEDLRQAMQQGSLTAFYLLLFNRWPTEFNNRRSILELGLDYRPVSQTIRDAVNSLL
ncbi:NAD-dependent epimerase/dehydratase family protein [Magnetovirga frankeli]|uniref:NAD-dependent epimerase/dehydratase family protein n=1 Tax=Magnetovirga frankeli TaxID=947516 RepID=UPI001AF2630E|nr:NAD-dependent epimerase/dehydratase family protein [gamma proteobacterium SS-5]